MNKENSGFFFPVIKYSEVCYAKNIKVKIKKDSAINDFY